MKKFLLSSFFAVAACFTLSSCGEDIINEIADELLGDSELVITDAVGGTYYSPDGPGIDTIKFSSSIMDAIVQIPNEDDTVMANVGLCAQVDLTQNTNIDYPYLAIETNDTNVGVFPIYNALVADNLVGMNVIRMIRNLAGHSMVVLAVNDTSWYVATSGNINVTTFPGYGGICEGNFNNVQAYYFTQSTLDNIETILNGSDELPAPYFRPVTLDGKFSCRRMNVERLLNRLATEGE